MQAAGLGLVLKVDNNSNDWLVDKIVEGSAASSCDVRPGDIVLAVRDLIRSDEFVSISGLSLDQVLSKF